MSLDGGAAAERHARDLEDALQTLQLPLEFQWPSRPTAFVLFLSGDGGWASLDQDARRAPRLERHRRGRRQLAAVLLEGEAARAGGRRPPSDRLGARARGKPIFVGGYSFGAEVGAGRAARVAPAERRQLSGLALIAPSQSASFEIDPLDWIRPPRENPATRVAPAVTDMGLPTLCVSGPGRRRHACRRSSGRPGASRPPARLASLQRRLRGGREAVRRSSRNAMARPR